MHVCFCVYKYIIHMNITQTSRQQTFILKLVNHLTALK